MDASENHSPINQNLFVYLKRLKPFAKRINPPFVVLGMEAKLPHHIITYFFVYFSKYGISTLAKECPITVIFLRLDKESKNIHWQLLCFW